MIVDELKAADAPHQHIPPVWVVHPIAKDVPSLAPGHIDNPVGDRDAPLAPVESDEVDAFVIEIIF